MKQILASFSSFDYWLFRLYLLVVGVCLCLAVVGQMPDSSAGWIHQPENPIGVCLKRLLADSDEGVYVKKRLSELLWGRGLVGWWDGGMVGWWVARSGLVYWFSKSNRLGS